MTRTRSDGRGCCQSVDHQGTERWVTKLESLPLYATPNDSTDGLGLEGTDASEDQGNRQDGARTGSPQNLILCVMTVHPLRTAIPVLQSIPSSPPSRVLRVKQESKMDLAPSGLVALIRSHLDAMWQILLATVEHSESKTSTDSRQTGPSVHSVCPISTPLQAPPSHLDRSPSC